MFTTNLRRQLAAIFCTVLMSSACVLSAVGPAQVDAAAVTRSVA
jgi:hypothetical protein